MTTGVQMIEYWDFYLYGDDNAPLAGVGTASTLPAANERDLVAELRSVVEEVTGKPVKASEPTRRIGFY